MAHTEIRILGQFGVTRDGVEVPPERFGGRLARRLVRVLVSRRGQVVSRDLLIECLWPRRAPNDPDANLNVQVNRARRALGDDALIETVPGGYRFVDDPSCVVDAETFLNRVDDAWARQSRGEASAALRRFRDALDGWGGEPLAEDAYEDWATGHRDRLELAYLRALEGAATAALTLRDPGQAAVYAQQAVARRPHREGSLLLLVQALAAGGDQVGALRTFEDFRRRLAEDTGMTPSPEALEVEAQILEGRSLVAHPSRPLLAVPPSGVPPLPFVLRGGETDALGHLVGGGVVTVAGRAGSGKSHLLRELADRSPTATVAVSAYLADRDEQWSLTRSLVREVLAIDVGLASNLPGYAMRALSDVHPEIVDIQHVEAVSLSPQTRRALILEAGVRLLSKAAAEGVLVVCDDLQWADTASVALLRSATARVPGAGWVLAYRAEEVSPGSEVATLLAEVEVTRDVLPITLDPWGLEMVAGLVADPELASTLLQATDGTPFALMEVVKALFAAGHLDQRADGRIASRSPEAVEEARRLGEAGQRRLLLKRVSRQPAGRRTLIELISLLGRSTSARLLATATGAEEPAVTSDLVALSTVDLTRLDDTGWNVHHDLVRETVAASLSREQRSRLHQLLAAALAGEGAEPAELARHLEGAGDQPAAARAYVAAASGSLDSFDAGNAERLAEAGLGVATEGEHRAALLETRALARARTGDLASARLDLTEALRLQQSPRARSRILTRLATWSLGAEDVLRASHLVSLALSEAGVDPAARARALATAALIDMNQDRPDQAQARSDEALELFEQAGDAGGVADILDGRAMATFLAGDIGTAIDEFQRVALLFADIGDLHRVVTPRSTRGHALLFSDRPQAAVVETAAAVDMARSLGHADGLGLALWHHSEVLTTLGRVAEAKANAEEALSVAERLGHHGWTATAHRALGIAAEASGELEEAEAHFRRSLASSDNLPLFAGWAAARLALVHIRQGDLAPAANLVERALDEGPDLGRYEARLAEAELAAARDDEDAADVVLGNLRKAETGGHHASGRRLRELARALGTNLAF